MARGWRTVTNKGCALTASLLETRTRIAWRERERERERERNSE